MKCDFHLHSNCSDGTFTPTEVVDHAHRLGLQCISLTDHDTFAGYAEAKQRCDELGIILVPGVEMTVDTKDRELHILGYFVDPEDDPLHSTLDYVNQCAHDRMKKMLECLADLGLPVTWEEVLAEAGESELGRPHLARVMLKKGQVETVAEAFQKYLGDKGEAYVRPDGISAPDAVAIIHEAGGICALAHPGVYREDNRPGREALVEFKRWGMDAVEVFHSIHDDETTSFYLRLARELDLGVTGGSDCHGTVYTPILMEKRVCPDWVGDNLFALHEAQFPDRPRPALAV
ncbi:MAG: PHP domain-containing protein [bacterium]